jgi:hypothetical protein
VNLDTTRKHKTILDTWVGEARTDMWSSQCSEIAPYVECLLRPRVRLALPIRGLETTEISSAQLNQNPNDQFKPDGPGSCSNFF